MMNILIYIPAIIGLLMLLISLCLSFVVPKDRLSKSILLGFMIIGFWILRSGLKILDK